jgi:hypothetical protein
LTASVLSGFVRYFPHGAVELANNQRIEIKRIVTLYSALFLVIESDFQRYLLWRDSCSEEQYRMLLFDEKRRRCASVK